LPRHPKRPTAWQNDLTPITGKDWNRDFAAHLLERAGFGGTAGQSRGKAVTAL